MDDKKFQTKKKRMIGTNLDVAAVIVEKKRFSNLAFVRRGVKVFGVLEIGKGGPNQISRIVDTVCCYPLLLSS